MHTQSQHIETIVARFPESSLTKEFKDRLNSDARLTRDENPQSHFCVFFAAFDPVSKKVFIGHHKKSGLWLFNGGHIDMGETPEGALQREMKEEWGLTVALDLIGAPQLLTITPIHNPTRQPCTKHFDIWYFIPLSEKTFAPDRILLEKEFFISGWKSISEARSLATNQNMSMALDAFEELFRDQ